MSTLLKWLARLLGGLALLLVGIVIVAAVAPPAVDAAPAAHGAGASSVEPSTSGLLRAFPATNEPADNPTTPQKAELGRLLFFDPVLSGSDDVSCAHCHHPDLGFGDGRSHAVGPGGAELARNTPGLWNVAYAQNLFWDGRLQSLEAQAEVPLTHPDEMGVDDTAALTAELLAIPAYADLFAAAFPGETIDFAHVERALAAFQRTLLTADSPFDRYAAGDFEALTAAQRRGLALFRSGATRCFECHAAPTFATDGFRVVGVPGDDPGRAGVSDDGLDGAFKVPALRNVALTAPYMHDGSLATLADVVDFYAEGGGLAHGRENVDVFVQGFSLTAQERDDLVAFLYALTDESQLPEVPTAVPSGLPVVARLENPERAAAAAHNVGGPAAAGEARAATTIRVQPGASIQAAVDEAQPGDTIEVAYGIYHERVIIDISDLTLVGVPNAAGEWPILDGEGVLADGVVASGNNFSIGRLQFKNYTDNGVIVEGVRNVHFYDLYAENTGTYGIYPVRSTDVLIERVEATGVDDAGIYAGQCENVVVRDSVAHGNVLGIELENTLNGEVYNNHVYDNTLGILIVLLPQLTSKVSANTQVYDNLVEDNNHQNFSPSGFARLAPVGTGILLLATDNADVTNNVIRDNKTTGVAVFSLTGTGFFDVNELDVGPLPEGNRVHGNTYENNATDPDPLVAELGIPAADVMWDGSGTDNRFNEEGASYFPNVLPGEGWPGFLRRAYGNVLTFLVGQLL
ncbi:MAG: right-handed parallel beta-helix repeat-containing protein [Anaerolineales bacterium]|nr:right-handed parallel beta-helix repeat-containing protein [Anaerolineales bacterium]